MSIKRIGICGSHKKGGGGYWFVISEIQKFRLEYLLSSYYLKSPQKPLQVQRSEI